MSVTVHFHDDPVTVRVLPSPDGAFIEIASKGVTIYLGGQGDAAVAHAEQLSADLMKACVTLLRARKDSATAVA